METGSNVINISYKDTDKDFIKHFDIKYSEIDGYIKTILDSIISEVDEKLVS